MVHIKRVELSHFKSFGGTTQVPLLPGFTVVSGPNGSGKSNILDALLFCLGLASSKGMRAERLPDLVNHKYSQSKGTSEVSVTVTFDLANLLEQRETLLDDEEEENRGHFNPEWSVTRRLRVTSGGNYSSTYYMDGEPCTATDLHDQLNRLRIYPEGYNVVLQGDVTRIITMNSKDRREIIDELAGVAAFDRKIDRAKQTLETVKEREERCKILEQELGRHLERLAADRIKAEKYQKLKAQIQEKQQWEIVLIWRSLTHQVSQVEAQIKTGETQQQQLREQLSTLGTEIKQRTGELEELNGKVKALGEDEQLSATSKLATQKAKRHQFHQRQQELDQLEEQIQTTLAETQQGIANYQHSLSTVQQDRTHLETNILTTLTQERDSARATLENQREQANNLASASEAWVQEQTTLNRKIKGIQQMLNPQRTEQAQLQERNSQLQQKIIEQTQWIEGTEQEITQHQEHVEALSQRIATSQEGVQTLAKKLAAMEEEQEIQKATETRLLKEQREKQRQLDKLEATTQAQQEAQGTYATKTILQSDLPGVCGLVAQLGQVEPRYQRALEIAAGGRLGHVVVEDDGIAAAGIELLKHQKAGRATFLPLNKIQPPRGGNPFMLRFANGFIDLAVNLITCESRYEKIFTYVLGSTIVFESLDLARPHIGKQRIVTLAGDLLESSGAMTGGSRGNRSSLHFGMVATKESEEMEVLRQRLQEIEQVLASCDRKSYQVADFVRKFTQELTEARQQERELQLQLKQLQRELEQLVPQQDRTHLQLTHNRQELETLETHLQHLERAIPPQEVELQQLQEALEALETSHTHSEWQQVQTQIQVQEKELQGKETRLREVETQIQDLENQRQRLEEKIVEFQKQIRENQSQKEDIKRQKEEKIGEIATIEQVIAETEALLKQVSAKLGETKRERDRVEDKLRSLQHRQQELSWEQEKLIATQQERHNCLATLTEQVQRQQAELPDPLPDIPSLVTPNAEEGAITFDNYGAQLEQLQKELRRATKRLESMEPVNMLALEEYDRTQDRLQELSDKLTTLEAERTELLLRIENFTTLRLRAFSEAFDAVNENFQSIFATLSEGDGYLQLDNAEDPFAGGLNLVAHPKGKPVQRLSSMSGGEKSLTALSFIFSLQRYRPSPFYAFDEVDMFLDGANVERLAKMIKQQAQQAQFIVVSLRRPMIESSERTIGVTQARGAYTQVLGIKL